MIDLKNEIELKKKLANKNIMITGGLGMIGSNLAHKLVNYNANVTIVDALIDPYGANMFNIKDIRGKIDLSITDIRDREAIKFLVKDKDVIFNLAGQVSHNDSIANPFLDADINYLGHLNMVENVKKHNPKAIILHSGSRLQFGSIESNPVNENHRLDPKTPYAFNKTVAENMYKYYSETHGLSCIAFRIANPYGIRSQMKHAKYSLINFFIRQAMEGKTLTIFGDGSQIRDYIYVEDLVDGMLAALVSSGAGFEVFNIGSGVGTRFSEMVQTVVDIVGNGEIKYVPWPDNYLNVETGDYITDISKLSTKSRWTPAINLKDGIEKTFNFYQEYHKFYW